MNKEDIGSILRYLKKKGIPKGKVAIEMAISPGYLSDVIGGRKPVTQEFLKTFNGCFEDYINEFNSLKVEKDEKGDYLKKRGEQQNTLTNMDKDKFDRVLDAHLRLINAFADHAEADLLRERNYTALIQENKSFAGMVIPGADQLADKKSKDVAKYFAAVELIDLIEQGKKGAELDKALEGLRKRVSQVQ